MKAILYMNGDTIPVRVESVENSFLNGTTYTLKGYISSEQAKIEKERFEHEIESKYRDPQFVPKWFLGDIHPCADDPTHRSYPIDLLAPMLGDFNRNKPLLKKDSIKEVIFNGPATIIKWTDGTKTVVKCQPDDMVNYDYETGIALAVMKKVLGNKGNFNTVMKKLIDNAKYE